MDRTGRIIAESRDLEDMRRRLGASASSSTPVSTAPSSSAGGPRWPSGFRDPVAGAARATRPPSTHIPASPSRSTEASGVELVDAVAASCASAFAYRIGDRRFIDGGYRTNADNADLAAGYDHVLAISPFGGRSRTPVVWGAHLADQVAALRASGSSVDTVVPDAAALDAFGDSMMDLSRRRAAARAGHAQATALAPASGVARCLGSGRTQRE